MLTVASSLLVAVVTALLAFRLNRTLEERKARIAARGAAYADFLLAIVEARVGEVTSNVALVSAARAKALYAKVRIGLYGSPEVIDAVVAFERAPHGNEVDATFIDLYQRMRGDGLETKAEPPRLTALLYTPERKDVRTLTTKEGARDGAP